MAVSPEIALERITSVMDRYAGAMKQVAEAYAKHRTPERDIYWLALQMAKEYGAMVSYSRKIVSRARNREPLASVRKASQDAYEEAEHYIGYRDVLEWALAGQPCEVPEMWGYGDFAEMGGPGPGMKRSLWPEHHDYVAMAKRLADETKSEWVRQVILANREGAAVAFHHAMSQLPVTDEYMKRLTALEREVARDELYHGPELIRELAKEVPSEAELQEAVDKITELRVQELKQRNEQFLHPLDPAALKKLEDDFRANRTETIPLFSALKAA
ncbi:MAG TPA: hypothetical protein VNN17_11190 [Terriglobia bacterium]|nr:hypothetical protein [Terriglobia bacterium]